MALYDLLGLKIKFIESELNYFNGVLQYRK